MRRDALVKYSDLIATQERNLKGLEDPKAAKLIAEHREVHDGFLASLGDD